MSDARLAAIEQALLAGLISKTEEAPQYRIEPLTGIDHSLLSSCWQKAIRRSDAALASRCVATLHAADPAYVWRRLRGIALEEVSVGDLELVGQVLAIAGKRVLRNKLGDLHLAVHLTRSLAKSTKCRTACDLLMWLDPPQAVDWNEVRAQTQAAPAWSLQSIAKQVSAWQSVVARSSFRGGRWVQLTHSDPLRRDQLIEWAGSPPLVQYIVQRGNATDSLNSLLAPVYQLSQVRCERFLAANLYPSSMERIGELPAYAYCLFSAPGRAALKQLLASTPQLTRFCRQAGIADPLRAIGHTVFQLEGGYCDRVCEVALGDQIRQAYEQATLERFGVTSQWQPELRDRVCLLLPTLNQMRHKVADYGRYSGAGRAGPLPLFGESSDESM